MIMHGISKLQPQFVFQNLPTLLKRNFHEQIHEQGIRACDAS